MHDIEVLQADFDQLSFGWHAHDSFAIGAIRHGVGGYRCRGENHVLPVGSLSLMNPEEGHTGHALDGPLQYTMLYASEAAVSALLDLRAARGFRDVVPSMSSANLTRSMSRLDLLMRDATLADCNKLEVEELVVEVLADTFEEFGGAQLRPAGKEPQAIRDTCELIEQAIDQNSVRTSNLSISEMARRVSLHPNYLIQSFKRAKGVPPHAWLLFRKACRAKELLAGGMKAVDVAHDLGFSDQAHLIRQFRKVFGVTPGAFLSHS